MVGTCRCVRRFACTTLVVFPLDISTFTGFCIDFTNHSPSHLGSSFPAVGIDSHTRFPTENEGVDHRSVFGCVQQLPNLFQRSHGTQPVWLGGVQVSNAVSAENLVDAAGFRPNIRRNGDAPVEAWALVRYAYSTRGRYCSHLS